MKRRAKVDANQSAIVLDLVQHGWTVQSLAPVGVGCPDLLVGAGGINVLLEVKDGDKPQSARCLTPDQRSWHRSWRGQVDVVCNEREAVLAVLTAIGKRAEQGQ